MQRSGSKVFESALLLLLFVQCIVLLSVASSPAEAKWPPLRLLPVHREGDAPPKRPCPECNLDPVSRLHQSGHPESIAWWARPTETPAYGGYYVGGGAPFFGRGRGRSEGTFGWDYFGHSFRRHVGLHWLTRGREHREGVEGYQTDGPHVLGELKGE